MGTAMAIGRGAVPMTHWRWRVGGVGEDWVLDIDVRACSTRPHDLLLKAVAHHTDERWVLLYIQRWLKAPMQMVDGTLVARREGDPAGVSHFAVARQLVHALCVR